MDSDGYRILQGKGEITIPKNFREKNNLEKGEKILHKEHSRDKTKLILKVPEK